MFNVSIYKSENVTEKVSGRSEVIPNQALSLRQIIERSARGMQMREMLANQLQYGEDENEDGEDLFDLTDDKFDVRDKLSYLEQRLEAAKAAKAAYEKEQVEKAVKAESIEAVKAEVNE